jgi:hypothetical protein
MVPMATFDPHYNYFKFRHFVMRKARHTLDESSQRFVQSVVETSRKRIRSIEKGSVLWRAQLDVVWESRSMPTSISLDPSHVAETVEVEMPAPLDPTRMVPLRDRAGEGRVNPKGIPCLYFSTDRDTAMAEVRPWIGSYVSVAQFITLRDLKVVDCSAEDGPRTRSFRKKEPEPGKGEEGVWKDINWAFSEPVTRSDDVAEYAPTQVLAEAFRNAGYDGVAYGSKLGTGKTIAIFDLDAAELASCEGYRVESIKVEFSRATEMHFSEKYLDPDGEFNGPARRILDILP